MTLTEFEQLHDKSGITANTKENNGDDREPGPLLDERNETDEDTTTNARNLQQRGSFEGLDMHELQVL